MSTAPVISVSLLSFLGIKPNADNPKSYPFLPHIRVSCTHVFIIQKAHVQKMNRSVDIRTAQIVHVEWYDGFVRLLILLPIPLTLNPSKERNCQPRRILRSPTGS
jgi:hypothetical protein